MPSTKDLLVGAGMWGATADALAAAIAANDNTELDAAVSAGIGAVVAADIGAVVTAQIGAVVAAQIGAVVASDIPAVVAAQIGAVVASDINASVTTVLAADVAAAVAATGADKDTTTAITKKVTVCTSATAATALGLKLPTGTVGLSYRVYNASSETISVYPAAGKKINGGADDAPVTIATGKSCLFDCVAAGTYWAMPSA